MTREEAIKVLEMFLHKQCDLARTKFAYDANTVWEAVNMASKLLEQEPRWIPVSERLPKIQNCGGNYLVTLKSGGVHIGMFIERNGKHWWTHYDDVIAWMPLPEPYKAESEDKE